ncbi:MAG: GNAT family N-acetyltransferase [Chloroflexi bacterium]|nr:GNAT family N-acetyltransferase [Chloroflexota bacterium]
MQIKTVRLRLREFVANDWRAVLAYQSDPRYLRFYEWETRTEEQVRPFVQMFVTWQEHNPRTKVQLAIERDGRLIGNVGVRAINPATREAEIGYELDPNFWGNGYATEAARALLEFGFRELELHRVSSWCIAENRASARVLEKLGLQCEGRLREREWFKGRWWDTLQYAILDREWSAH